MSGIMKQFGNVMNKAHIGTATIGLEAQRKAKENTVNQAMQRIKEQRENVFTQIGRQCHIYNQQGSFEDERFTEFFAILSQNDSELAAQEKLLEEIRTKYEEEIRQLRGENTAASANCPKCGTTYAAGVLLFCSNCGEDLRKPAAAACPGCGSAYEPGHRFCKKCGHKLIQEETAGV